MIQNVNSFIKYFDGIRHRTLTFARAIPANQIEWSPQKDEFTFGDILRHLVTVEKITIAAAVNKKWEVYPGHDQEMARSLEEVLHLLEDTHTEAMCLLNTLPDSELQQRRIDLTARPLKAWRLLMAMVEHEIHHRSQLASYLALLGVTPPQIFGLEVDDVVAMSTRLAGDHSHN